MKFSQFKATISLATSLVVVMLLSSLAFMGCSNEDNPITTPTPKTITELVTSNDKLTLLTAAVNRAGLATTLSGTGPFTVFAPSDDAFRAAGFADAAAINAASAATLTNILQYHVVSGTALAGSDFTTGQTAFPTSVSGNAPLFVNKGSITSINSATIAQPDVRATNGIIHVVDQVIMPPAGNILQIVQADTSLSLLTAAAVRGGAAVTSALSSSATPVTVFAPTNAAFRLTPFNSVSAINAADPATLTAVLTNHVLAPARAYSPMLVNGPVTTFGGGSVTVAVGSNRAVTLLSKGNGTTAANVTRANINATNGVIHKIDKVLLP